MTAHQNGRIFDFSNVVRQLSDDPSRFRGIGMPLGQIKWEISYVAKRDAVPIAQELVELSHHKISNQIRPQEYGCETQIVCVSRGARDDTHTAHEGCWFIDKCSADLQVG